MRFSYASGSRPLEGYTIKRGIGVGGFGEVYFALNDAGKEVALKKIQRNLDIELRGVRHCLNLKHVNLISLWDIRTSELGESWVVMEYVPGPSLRDVVESHQQGMPEDQLKRWFTSTCSGVAYLHEHGIVHRDLKPGNIFHDQDERVIKIGDYGLSKFISHSKRSRQTESVGTFHYMAPEIGKGEYGKEIDIYAMGIILFEMLTGEIPFDGESAQEIIMKHLTMDADVSAIPPAFQRVISKSLRKDPHKRYRSISQMVRDLPWPDISGSPDSIVSRHSVGPIHLDSSPNLQTLSTADHPGSPPTESSQDSDPSKNGMENTATDNQPTQAEIVARLPPVLIDGRDIEIIQRGNEGIEFGPLKDSSHTGRQKLLQPDSNEIQFLDDRTPHSHLINDPTKSKSSPIDVEADTTPNLNSKDLAQVRQTTSSPSFTSSASGTSMPLADRSGTSIGVADDSARSDDNSQPLPGTDSKLMSIENASVSISNVESQPSSGQSEPIADAVRSSMNELFRGWNNANFSTPIRIILLVTLSVIVIQNPTWLLPTIAGLATVYLIYYLARMFYLDPTLHENRSAEQALRIQNEDTVRNWLASRPSADRMTELVGSMLIGAVSTIALSLFGISVFGIANTTMNMWAVFTWQTLIGIAAVWLILVTTKSWSLKRAEIRSSDFWVQTAIMIVAGVFIGGLAFLSASSFEIDLARITTEDFSAKQTSHLTLNLMPKFPAIVLCFALLFGLARFGGHTDQLRRTRLSVTNVIACLVLAVVLSHVFNVPLTVLSVLGVVVSITVQIASPWMHPDEQLEICRSQE